MQFDKRKADRAAKKFLKYVYKKMRKQMNLPGAEDPYDPTDHEIKFQSHYYHWVNEGRLLSVFGPEEEYECAVDLFMEYLGDLDTEAEGKLTIDLDCELVLEIDHDDEYWDAVYEYMEKHIHPVFYDYTMGFTSQYQNWGRLVNE